MRNQILFAATLVAVLVVGALGTWLVVRGAEDSSIHVTGTMAVPWDYGQDGQACVAGGGYEDINGAQVVVTNESGEVLAVGSLPAKGTLRDGNLCTFPFSVTVPDGHEYYGVEVSHRGRVQYSWQEIKAGSLQLTL